MLASGEYIMYTLSTYVCMYPFSALTLLVGWQDGHPEKGPLNGCVCVYMPYQT